MIQQEQRTLGMSREDHFLGLRRSLPWGPHIEHTAFKQTPATVLTALRLPYTAIGNNVDYGKESIHV